MEGRPKPGGLLDKNTSQRLFALGSHLGEVVRRKEGGRWVPNPQDPDDSFNLAIELDGGSVIWPMHRVQKRFVNGKGDSLHFYGAALTRGFKPSPQFTSK